MVYKAIANKKGIYKNNEGVLFDKIEATNVMTPQGKNVGWSEHSNIEEAAKSFGLIYVGSQDEKDIISILRTMLSEEVNK